jgi:hypothetical protein
MVDHVTLESVSEYATRLRLLGRQIEQTFSATPDAAKGETKKSIEERIFHQFLNVLRWDIKRFVLVRNPTGIEMAIESAQIEETNEVPLKEMQSYVAAVETAAQATKPPPPPPGNSYRGRFRSNYGARRLQCFICGQFDHLARTVIWYNVLYASNQDINQDIAQLCQKTGYLQSRLRDHRDSKHGIS